MGNPVDTMLGNKVHTETDYLGTGPDPIVFTRYYNSDPRVPGGSVGAKWRHSYDRELVVDGSVATLYRADGSVIGFSSSGGVWSPDAGYRAQLVVSGSGYEVALSDGSTEAFDGAGLLQSVTDPRGNTQTVARDPSNRISRVENAFGDFIVFDYGAGASYRELVQSSAPVVYWRLEENSGTTAQDEQGAYAGTYVSSPSLGAPGLVDASLAADFELQDGHHLTSNFGFVIGNGARTFEAWVRVESLNTALYEGNALLSYGTKASYQKFVVRLEDGDIGVAGAVRVEIQGGKIIGSTPIHDGEKHHIAIVYSGAGTLADVEIWVDGIKDAISASSGLSAALNTTGAYKVTVAKDPISGRGDRFFDGVIDEIAFYDRQLSAQEIADHHAAGINGPTSMTVTVTGPGNRAWVYAYQAGNLVRVTHPDGSYRQYTYERVAQWDGMLTGVTDERGVQVATYSYDPDTGAANLTTHINNVGRREITYHEDGTRIVTDSLGRVKTYNTTKSLGEILPAQITR